MRSHKPGSDIEDQTYLENDEIDHSGYLHLAKPIRESFRLVKQPCLSAANGPNPVVIKSIPHSDLKYILPNSKVLTYGLGI